MTRKRSMSRVSLLRDVELRLCAFETHTLNVDPANEVAGLRDITSEETGERRKSVRRTWMVLCLRNSYDVRFLPLFPG